MFKNLFSKKEKPPALCPFCGNQVEKPITRYTTSATKMYTCPHCNKILGFSDWK